MDYINLRQYKEVKNNNQEYIINYNEFRNDYCIIFPNMISNIYDIGLFVQEFSITYNYNTFIDFTYYNETIVYIPIPLQLLSKKNKKDFYSIMLYKRNNQIISNGNYKNIYWNIIKIQSFLNYLKKKSFIIPIVFLFYHH